MHKLFKSGILVSHNCSTLLDVNQMFCGLVILMKVSHAGDHTVGFRPSFLGERLSGNCDILLVVLPVGSVGFDQTASLPLLPLDVAF